MGAPVFITGMGICSPIGSSLKAATNALLTGQSGIGPIDSFDCSKMTMRHAGEVKEIPNAEQYPKDRFRMWDRGTRMAMHAAGEALQNAAIVPSRFPAQRFGVVCGTSGSGQYQNARFGLERGIHVDEQLTFFLSRNSPHFQSSQVAGYFGIRGPNLAIGAATAGGGIALATAMTWLRTDRVDAVLVGGSESFSLLNVLGFDQLGLTIPNPCTPFSGTPGMTFGEGAGFVILESEASVQRRGATPHAKLSGAAIRADGFDPIMFDPSGNGLSRAMQEALNDADCRPDQIDWIRASGTGGRDQDLAETLAIKSVFDSPPPVSSLEPYLGHANGAGPTIGLVAAVLCLQNDLIPETLGYTTPRPGCDLDYVTNGSRATKIRRVLCSTMAFGGTNCAFVIDSLDSSIPTAHAKSQNGIRRGQLASSKDLSGVKVVSRVADIPSPASDQDNDGIVITGLGMVSALGCGDHRSASAFLSPSECLSATDRLNSKHHTQQVAGLVQGFSPRRICPAIKLRGTELLTQYAAGSVATALQDASLEPAGLSPERIGLISAVARTSGSVFTRLFGELQQGGFRPLVGRLMLRNGRFMIASQLANWFDLRGFSSTLSLGIGSGIHALVSAYDQLRRDPSLDAMVVVACDELSPMTMDLMRTGGMLRDPPASWKLHPQDSSGFIPGEGSVAVVLERKRFATARGAQVLAHVSGAGMTFDGLLGDADFLRATRPHWESNDIGGEMLARCYQVACEQAGIKSGQLDLHMSNATGVSNWDKKEIAAAETFYNSAPHQACINGHIGVCEAASSLFNLAAAIQSLDSTTLPVSQRWSRSTPELECTPVGASQGTVRNAESVISMNGSETQLSPIASSSKIKTAMVSASTEHGHNAAVVLSTKAPKNEFAGERSR